MLNSELSLYFAPLRARKPRHFGRLKTCPEFVEGAGPGGGWRMGSASSESPGDGLGSSRDSHSPGEAGTARHRPGQLPSQECAKYRLRGQPESPSHNLVGPALRVGLLSSHLPRELFYALGCLPLRVFPTASKATAAESFLPRNFCALTRLILASFLEDGELDLDAVVFADDDDAMRRLYDVWNATVSVPAWGFVEVPRSATDLAIGRYAATLAALAAQLEAHTGRPLAADALRRAIAVYNEQRRLLAELKRSWLAGAVDTTTYRRLRRIALSREPLAANRQLQQVLTAAKESEVASSAPDPSRPAQPPRLLLLGELAVPTGLVRLLETSGARIVAEDSDLDERDLQELVPNRAQTTEELLTALARAYLSRPPGPRRRDLPQRLAHISRLVTARRVQAAICAYNKFCDLYLAEYPALKEHLDSLGVPVLLLELEDEALSGQHRTRVEAFLEMTREQ